MPLWPKKGRFETRGLQGAPSNCRKHNVSEETCGKSHLEKLNQQLRQL
jgi:hypothetical protein